MTSLRQENRKYLPHKYKQPERNRPNKIMQTAAGIGLTCDFCKRSIYDHPYMTGYVNESYHTDCPYRYVDPIH